MHLVSVLSEEAVNVGGLPCGWAGSCTGGMSFASMLVCRVAFQPRAAGTWHAPSFHGACSSVTDLAWQCSARHASWLSVE